MSFKVSGLVLISFVIYDSVAVRQYIDPTRTSNISLTNYNNEYYTASFNLGEPLKYGDERMVFELKLDTTSPYLWVLSKNCRWSVACWTRKTYDSKKSLTYFAPVYGKVDVTIDYEGGEVTGILSNDVLTSNMVSTYIDFGEITSVKTGSLHFDGVLGLGLIKDNVKGQALKSDIKGLLESTPFGGFSLYLTRGNTKKNQGGELLIGDMNTDLFKVDTLIMHPLLVGTNSWTVKLDSINVNNNLNWECGNCTATFDVSSTQIKIPATILRVFRAFVSADSDGQFDCSNEFPTINFVLSGIKYTLNPSITKKKRYIIETVCYDGLAESSSDKEWVFGTDFLVQYYTVWDMNERQFGIAQLLK